MRVVNSGATVALVSVLESDVRRVTIDVRPDMMFESCEVLRLRREVTREPRPPEVALVSAVVAV